MDWCNPVGTIPTVGSTRPALTTPLMGVGVREQRPVHWLVGRRGGAPALFGVARPKAAAAVDLQGQPPRNSGTGLHGDRNGGGNLGQRLHAGVQQQDR
jgi:hypothetical protein